MNNTNLWTTLNFGLPLWIAIGGVCFCIILLSGFPITYSYIFCIIVFMWILKIYLTYKTDEFFSLQYLVQ